MSDPRALVLSDSFRRQAAAVVLFYESEAGTIVANHFINALETALQRIREHPHSGSVFQPSADADKLAGFIYRKFSLSSFSAFPYFVFYDVDELRINVRLLHHQSRHHETLLVPGDKPSKKTHP